MRVTIYIDNMPCNIDLSSPAIFHKKIEDFPKKEKKELDCENCQAIFNYFNQDNERINTDSISHRNNMISQMGKEHFEIISNLASKNLKAVKRILNIKD